MDSFEWNKIIGAVLGTAIFIFVVRLVAEHIYEAEKPEKPGYVVEGVVETAAGGGAAAPVEETMPDWGTVLAAADVAAGKALVSKCEQCHDVTKGGPNKIGPNLFAVVDRPRGSHEGFAYSSAMKDKPATGPMTSCSSSSRRRCRHSRHQDELRRHAQRKGPHQPDRLFAQRSRYARADPGARAQEGSAAARAAAARCRAAPAKGLRRAMRPARAQVIASLTCLRAASRIGLRISLCAPSSAEIFRKLPAFERDLSEYPELAVLTANFPVIRRECDSLIRSSLRIPGMEELTSYTPAASTRSPGKASCSSRANSSTRIAPWRRNRALLRGIPGVYTAFFSVLEPHQHIKAHWGYWKGFVRYHLGVVIPATTATTNAGSGSIRMPRRAPATAPPSNRRKILLA
jgi:hypothetical protein